MVTFTIEGNDLHVRGDGFGDGGKLWLVITSMAENGDRRSAKHWPTVAHSFVPTTAPDGTTICGVCGRVVEEHTYAAGDIDFDEPIVFGSGTLQVQLYDRPDGELIGEEVFNLGG